MYWFISFIRVSISSFVHLWYIVGLPFVDSDILVKSLVHKTVVCLWNNVLRQFLLTYWVIVILVVVGSKVFLRSAKSPNFTLSFRCPKIVLTCFEKGRAVMKSFLCIGASSISKSSFKFSQHAQIQLYSGLPSLKVSLTSNSSLSRIHNLMRAKMLWHSKRNNSTACFSFAFDRESAQLNLFIKVCFDCWSCCRYNCFSFFSL